MDEAQRKKRQASMEAEEEAQAIIKALTVDFEKEYGEQKLPKEVAVWLGVLEMPRKLRKSGDSRIDLIVSTLFDLACSMDKGFGEFVALNDEMEELLEDKSQCVEKKEALDKAATEAREKVQVGAFPVLYPSSTRRFFHKKYEIKPRSEKWVVKLKACRI